MARAIMAAGRVAVASVVGKGSNSEAGGGKVSGDSSGGDGCGGKGAVGGVDDRRRTTYNKPTKAPQKDQAL